MNNSAPSEKTKKISPIVGWMICGLGAFFYCYEYLLRIEPSVIVQQLMQQFHVTAATFGLLASLYYLAYTPMQLVVGVLTDRFGPRRVLTLAVIGCAIGSYIFGSSNVIYVAGFGRFLIGLGSAFAFVGVLKLAAIWLPANRFALFAGLATALGMVGAMVGDIELTSLVQKVGWKDAIFFGTLLGVVLIPIIWFGVRDRGPRTDDSPSSLKFNHVLKGLLSVVRNPQLWIAGFIGCMLYMSLSVFGELWGISFLHVGYHFDSEHAATAISMIFLGWLIGAPFSGWLSETVQSRRLPLAVGSIVGAVIISIVIYDSLSLTWMYTLLFLYGFFCSVEIITFAIGRENHDLSIAATAVAFVNMLIMFGGMAFQPLVGFLMDLHWKGLIRNGVHIYTLGDYRSALIVLPIGLVISAILVLFLRESYGER